MRCGNCNAELPEDAEWCSQCLSPVKATSQHEPAERSEPEPVVTEPPEYSAIRSGPYSFGLVGRLVITAVIILAGVGLAILGVFLTNYLETPGLALVWLILIPYTVLGLIFLWGTWRPTRVK